MFQYANVRSVVVLTERERKARARWEGGPCAVIVGRAHPAVLHNRKTRKGFRMRLLRVWELNHKALERGAPNVSAARGMRPKRGFEYR